MVDPGLETTEAIGANVTVDCNVTPRKPGTERGAVKTSGANVARHRVAWYRMVRPRF